MAISRQQVEEFLYREARYLDDRQWDDWLALYQPHAEFWMPSWDDDDKLVENPQANGMQLFFAGKLKVTGNQMMAMKLQKLFSYKN